VKYPGNYTGGIDPLRVSGLVVVASAVWGIYAALTIDMALPWRVLGFLLAAASFLIGIRWIISRSVFQWPNP